MMLMLLTKKMRPNSGIELSRFELLDISQQRQRVGESPQLAGLVMVWSNCGDVTVTRQHSQNDPLKEIS